jgi:hypothetical protein
MRCGWAEAAEGILDLEGTPRSPPSGASRQCLVAGGTLHRNWSRCSKVRISQASWGRDGGIPTPPGNLNANALRRSERAGRDDTAAWRAAGRRCGPVRHQPVGRSGEREREGKKTNRTVSK